jgi:hypothetical protein
MDLVVLVRLYYLYEISWKRYVGTCLESIPL